MKLSLKSILVLFLFTLSFVCPNLFAQEWKNEKSKDGSIEVKSRISQPNKDKGNGIPVIEYIATTDADVTLENCIAVIKNFSNHTDFFQDTPIVKQIREISNKEWLVYYYTDAPWPMPNSDCVTLLKFSEDKKTREAKFVGVTSPDAYEMKDVKRMTLNEIVYYFKENDDNTVTIKISGKFSPVVDVPDWLMDTWAPKGPAEMVEGIVKLAEK